MHMHSVNEIQTLFKLSGEPDRQTLCGLPTLCIRQTVNIIHPNAIQPPVTPETQGTTTGAVGCSRLYVSLYFPLKLSFG